MILLAAFFCALLTLLGKSDLLAFHFRASPAVDVAQASEVQTEDVGPPQAEPVAAAEVGKRDPPKPAAKPKPDAEPKSRPRALSVDELQALDAKKPAVAAAADAHLPDLGPGGADPVVRGGNPIFGGANPIVPVAVPKDRPPAPGKRARADRKAVARARNHLLASAFARWTNRPIFDGHTPTDDENTVYTPDPATGALLSADKQWRVRRRYYLPIDGREIDSARRQLLRSDPVIELEWWAPRSAEIHEMHYRGKLAKLRFLAAVHEGQAVETGVRVIATRGSNPGGVLLVEAEAIFYQRRSGPLKHPIRETHLLPSEIEEKPGWFLDGKQNIKRGDIGSLPIHGPEIEAVRAAVSKLEEDALIREAKWWPARVNREDGHRMSKLRYEAIHGNDIQLSEFVYDYKLQGAGYPRSSEELFPEDDRHAVSLAPGQREPLEMDLPEEIGRVLEPPR
jgi:hypothetical protein